MNSPSSNLVRAATLAAVLLATNIALAKLSNLLLLPFTMDTVGTILAAALLPPAFAFLVGGLTSVLGTALIHPAFIFYIGTQFVIAAAAVMLVRLGMFVSPMRAAIAGLLIGGASAIVSAPVTAMVFGGISVPSITALNAVFLASGQSLWNSVIGGALIVESVDKVAAGLIVWLLLKRIAHEDA